MTYLELAPAITAMRSRPEEFEFSNDTLHHLRSRHRFKFISDDEVEIHAACDCATLRASPEQARAFHQAYRAWHAAPWRPPGIKPPPAAPFAPPPPPPPAQPRAFHQAYRAWHAAYWRPLEINRQFAAHFDRPPLWQRLAIRLLRRLLSRPPSAKPRAAPAG